MIIRSKMLRRYNAPFFTFFDSEQEGRNENKKAVTKQFYTFIGFRHYTMLIFRTYNRITVLPFYFINIPLALFAVTKNEKEHIVIVL
jgi:hypothetical protein